MGTLGVVASRHCQEGTARRMGRGCEGTGRVRAPSNGPGAASASRVHVGERSCAWGWRVPLGPAATLRPGHPVNMSQSGSVTRVI